VDIASTDHGSGDVGTCDDLAAGLLLDLIRRKGEPQTGQAEANRLVPLPPSLAKAKKVVLQGRTTDADAVAQKMERKGSLGGELDPRQSRKGTVTTAFEKLGSPAVVS
jgi:hypothetical protein